MPKSDLRAVEPPGATFHCIFQVSNQDPVFCVVDLTVQNSVNGGPPTLGIPCNQPNAAGSPVTTLGPNDGSGFVSCFGILANEIAPLCDPAGSTAFNDHISANGTDQSTVAGRPVSAETTNGTIVLACTPTPLSLIHI